MRLFFVLLLVAAVPALFAQDAVAAIPSGAPWWAHMIWLGLTAVVMPFVLRFLNSKAEEARKRAEAASIDTVTAHNTMRNELIDKRVLPYLYETAALVVEDELPDVMQDILDGNGEVDWKGHLKRIKARLQVNLVEKWKQEGVDILTSLGQPYLSDLLDRAVRKAIPFLPEAMHLPPEASKKLADFVVSNGLAYARERFGAQGKTGLLG